VFTGDVDNCDNKIVYWCQQKYKCITLLY